VHAILRGLFNMDLEQSDMIKASLDSNVINLRDARIGNLMPRDRIVQEAREPGPIEIKMKATLSSLKDTKYPDTFDWSVYDRLSEKFDEPPRGGVVFNTTLKLVNFHSTCSKCHYAFEIDAYGRGCFHNCVYCYAKDQLTAHGFWNRPQPFPVNLAEVRKIFYTVFETSKPSKWREVMEKRVPLRIGSMSDSFMWMDTKYGVTKELLKILNFYKYPYLIFTRSDLVAHDDYMALLEKDLCGVQFSIAGNNQAFIRAIEPGAPSYERRLRALQKLSKNGIWTTVRVNPLFPKYPDGYFTDPDSIVERFGSRENVAVMNWYDENFVSEIADAGVPSILAGFVRLSPKAINSLSSVTGIDVRTFFKPENLKGSGDKQFSDAEIAYYYRWFTQECKKNKIRFNTCYIGNGIKDYFQYQDLWSNKQKDCCDAKGNIKAFKDTSQSIPWEFREKQASVKCSIVETKRQEAEADALYAAMPRAKAIHIFKSTDQITL
jgi:DNA repair photolyase